MINIEENFIIKTIKPFIKKQNKPVWLVGGFLRDIMLNLKSIDVDIVVPKNTAEEFSKKLSDEIQGHFVELDSTNKIYRVVFADKKNYIDIADCVGTCIEEDLKRRDFTMNALAYDIAKEKLIDITGAISDINLCVIREISKENILDDPIRILRAFRFHSKFGFDFSDELKIIIKENAKCLNTVAKERINTELLKLFEGKYVVSALHLLDEYGILELIFPQVKEIKKVPPNSHHHLWLLEHSIETVNQIQNFYDLSDEKVKKHLDKEFSGGQKRLTFLKIGAFLHDVGKPETWQIDKETGRHRFIMHDSVGAELISPTLKDLKFSKKQIAYIKKIIKNHIYPSSVVSNEAGEKAYLRFYRKMEEETIDLIAIAYADRMSALGPDVSKEMVEKNIEGLKKLLNGYLEQMNEIAPLPKLLDGKEIMEILNIKQGPELGKIIEKLKEAQLSSEVNTKEDAVNFVKNAYCK